MRIFICFSILLSFFYSNEVSAASKVRGHLSIPSKEVIEEEKMDQDSAGSGSLDNSDNFDRAAKRNRSGYFFVKEEKGSVGDVPLVLGISRFFDGALLRGSDRRIYVVENGLRRYIKNLADLDNYRGRQIFDVDDEVITEYTLNPFSNEVLLRGGDFRIYFVQNNRKKYIKNLEELRRYYAGREILNVSNDVIALYS